MANRAALATALLLATAACAPVAPAPPPPTVKVALPPMRQFAPQPASPPKRSNAAMAQDFLDLAFEMESGRAVPLLTRFEGPISVAMAGAIPPTAETDLQALLARLRAEAGLPIHMASQGQAPNLLIAFQPKAAMQKLVPSAACFVVPGVLGLSDYLNHADSAALDWTKLTRRSTATLFIPSDASPQEVRDCLHEETAQALGPLNDLYRLPDSVFNDDNFQAVLTGFDMLMLRAHYAPDLANGMTRAEVAARLPGLLARLNPAGEARAGSAPGATPRKWIEAVETALGQDSAPRRQLRAAEQALQIAQDQGWQDARKGFSLFILGRVLTGIDPAAAAAAFQAARAVYLTLPDHAVQLAHVDMQLAAYALTQKDGATAARLARGAIPAATQAQNAGLLASLLLIEAAGVELQGNPAKAQALRAESLGWARYGIGDDVQMLALMADIASLAGTGGEG